MQAWKNGLGAVIDHTPQLAASKPAVKPRHTPSFVVEWVERWLGPDEIRHIICAAVGLNDFAIDGAGGEMPPEMLLDLSTEFVKYAAGVIQESGGVILEQRPTQIVACWGYPSANLAGMSLALKAIETIVQSDQWKGRAGAAIDAGSALIQPLTLTAQEDIRSDHPKIGKRGIRVSSILVERTSRLLPTTRPGEIAILPTAHALIPDSTTSTHLAPLQSGMLPDGLGKISIEETIFLLERSPAGTQLLPSIRAAIADTADGIPAIAIMLAMEFGPEDTDHSRLAQMAVATNRVGIQLARELEKDLPARGLVRAISVCGRVIDAAVVADALEVSPAAMGDALDGLCDAGVLERYRSTVMKPALTGLGMDGGRPGLQFQFASRLLRDAARHTLPGAVRRRLHQRLARAMAFQYDRGVALDPADIAAQFADSGDASAAIQWWHRAATGAIRRSAAQSAVRHLTSALASLPDIADADEERPRHDTAGLTRLLGPQLAAVHGNASGSVLSAYERYAELNAGLSPPAPRETFDVLWGVQTFHVVRGDVRTARRMGRLLMDCAEAAQHSDSQADDMLILAHRMQGLCAFLTGHPIRAIRHYDWVLSHYVAERHAGLRHTYASDQAALAHAHRAWALIIAGDLPAARASGRAAMRAAEIVDHPHTTAHVVSVLAVAELTAGLREAAMPLAMAGRAIAQHHGFTYWSAWCGIILADLEPGRSTTRVLCALTRAIRDYEATSARQALPFSYMLLANRALDDGQDSAALDALDHGLQAADATGVACYTPELLRLYSICRYRLGFGDFRNHLRQARRKAAQGDAKLFEKRIASTMLEIPLR